MVHLSEADGEALPFLLLLSTLRTFCWPSLDQTDFTDMGSRNQSTRQPCFLSRRREHSREKQGHSGPYGVKACLGHSHVRKPEYWGGERAVRQHPWRVTGEVSLWRNRVILPKWNVHTLMFPWKQSSLNNFWSPSPVTVAHYSVLRTFGFSR